MDTCARGCAATSARGCNQRPWMLWVAQLGWQKPANGSDMLAAARIRRHRTRRAGITDKTPTPAHGGQLRWHDTDHSLAT